jgi:hypothetical protein
MSMVQSLHMPFIALVLAMNAILSGVAAAWHAQGVANALWETAKEWAEAFDARFCREVRFRQQEARRRLQRGLRQLGSSVHDYVHRLQTAFIDVGDMGENEAVSWFLHGLDPELKAMVGTDASGLPWTSLSALVQYTLGAEMRVKMSTKFVPKHLAAAQTASTTPKKTPKLGEKKSYVQAAAGAKRPASAPGSQQGDKPLKKQQHEKLAEDRFGPPSKPNKKFSHLSNGEVVKRMNEGRCMHCGEQKHTSQNCPHKNQQPK